MTAAEIEQVLRAALAPSRISVRDDSAQHAGHSGAPEGSVNTHFSVAITSDRFAGLARVRRHRLVYDSLGPLEQLGIHALAIDARSPGDA